MIKNVLILLFFSCKTQNTSENGPLRCFLSTCDREGTPGTPKIVREGGGVEPPFGCKVFFAPFPQVGTEHLCFTRCIAAMRSKW